MPLAIRGSRSSKERAKKMVIRGVSALIGCGTKLIFGCMIYPGEYGDFFVGEWMLFYIYLRPEEWFIVGGRHMAPFIEIYWSGLVNGME